jgi:hypothetical protein
MVYSKPYSTEAIKRFKAANGKYMPSIKKWRFDKKEKKNLLKRLDGFKMF